MDMFLHRVMYYSHSLVLEERLNIGVLLIFPNQKKVCFLYPKKLLRLKRAYCNAPTKLIKMYFNEVIKKIKEINKNPQMFEDIDSLSKKLLIEDSSSLQFGKVCTSLLYTDDLEKIEADYHSKYLYFYN